MPPAGVSTSALAKALSSLGPVGDDLLQWMSVDHPVWGRNLAKRMVVVQTYCKKVEEQKPPP